MKRPHILAIDDGPFDKWKDKSVPIVGVVMEGGSIVEGVALSELPVDGENVTGFLASWISSLKWFESLHGVVFGGITIAGLSVIDIKGLAREINLPVISVTRKSGSKSSLSKALISAGLKNEIAKVEASPSSNLYSDGVYYAFSGADKGDIETILEVLRGKSKYPEPLRVAHLIAAALVRGESHGRV